MSRTSRVRVPLPSTDTVQRTQRHRCRLVIATIRSSETPVSLIRDRCERRLMGCIKSDEVEGRTVTRHVPPTVNYSIRDRGSAGDTITSPGSCMHEPRSEFSIGRSVGWPAIVDTGKSFVPAESMLSFPYLSRNLPRPIRPNRSWIAEQTGWQ